MGFLCSCSTLPSETIRVMDADQSAEYSINLRGAGGLLETESREVLDALNIDARRIVGGTRALATTVAGLFACTPSHPQVLRIGIEP